MTSYQLAVLPAEHRAMRDPLTGAEVLFITTSCHRDLALYFHQRSWLADESVLLFNSERPQGGLMGYIFATGELVRITTPAGELWGATAARERNSLFAFRGTQVLELALTVEPSPDPARSASVVTASERVLCALPEDATPYTLLTENADGSLVGAGIKRRDTGAGSIITIDVNRGQLRQVCPVVFGSSHVLFSRTSPHLLSFNGTPGRLWLVDVREGAPWPLYQEAPGEYATHESWWVNDQLIFIGGFRDKQGDVKLIDAHTGVVRIIGAGAWVPWRNEGEHVINRWNWWEATGDEAGRWIVADNWYGDIVLFDGKTTQLRRLTLGHRRYKQALEEQPTAAWDRRGRRVVFTSQWLGPANVCVATIPDAWPPDPADEGLLVARGVPGKRYRQEPGWALHTASDIKAAPGG